MTENQHQQVLGQLITWKERNIKVWVFLDLGFASLGSYCAIEQVDDQHFGLTESNMHRVFFVSLARSSRMLVEDFAGGPMVRILSEDRMGSLSIFEATGDLDDPTTLMASAMIH